MPKVATGESVSNRNSDVKAQIEAENRKRVQRRKEEAAIMRGLSQNMKLSLDELRKQHELEVQSRSQSEPTQTVVRTASANKRERPPPVQCVGCFDTPVLCFETTHGGATVWTGHDDGTVAIRNGVSGNAVYLIEPPAGQSHPPAVTRLFAADSHMWVGLSDGTIRIYDTLVFVLAFESKLHSDPLVSFASTFDTKVFSASRCAIVKWDSELANFDVLAHLKELDGSIRCLCTYGYNLFAGTGHGGNTPYSIVQFDTETLAEVQRFAHHTGPVNALAVAEGFLVSASDDAKVIIWSIDTAEAFHELDAHLAPIKALMWDSVAHRLWTSDETGVVHIWDMNPTCGFPVVSSFQTDADAAILQLKGIVAVDAVKMWSLGSDGRNNVWHGATNRIESQINLAVDAMRAIIDEDTVELAKWAELIKTMRSVGQKLKKNSAVSMSVSITRNRQLYCYYQWLRFLYRRYGKKKRLLIVNLSASEAAADLRRRYFLQWAQSVRVAKERSSKDVAAVTLASGWQRVEVGQTYRKMRSFALLIKKRQHKEELARQLASKRSLERLSSTFAVWRRSLDSAGLGRRKRRWAAALALVAANHLRRLVYWRWMNLLQARLRLASRNRCAVGFQLRMQQGLLRTYFHNWLDLTMRRRSNSARAKATLVLSRLAHRSVLSVYFGAWQRFALLKMEAKLTAAYEGGKGKCSHLLEQMKSIEHVVRRQKLLDDAQKALDAAESDRISRRDRVAMLKAEIADLEQQIVDKRAGAQAKRQRTIAEQVEDLIARLKVKVLNLHQDFALIHKTLERIRLDPGGVTKLFLEGHISVKKIVVEITHVTYLGTQDEWPLTEALVKELKPHYAEPVLTAIKQMIIAFDTMTPADRAAMTTDQEIVLNAKWLILFADVCVDIRMKKLGKAGAFRVKG